jgi:4-azaleucine resistance transporter AzlC
METTYTLRQSWFQAMPIILGYLPIGFAFGILSVNAGVSPYNTLAMSILVYAGSAQLIAVSLLAGGISPVSIILTTLVVNLRHLLMSAALSPYVRDWPKKLVALFAFELTDETFGLHSIRFPKGETSPAETIGINLIAQLGWVGGTWMGIAAGELITDVRPFGLDYALPAMFIALLVFQIQGRSYAIVAGAAAALSLGLYLAGAGQWNVILATIIAATLGVFLEIWIRPSSS